MKKIITCFTILLFFQSYGQNTCGIIPGFNYTFSDEIILTSNTTSVVSSDVNSLIYTWEFSDGYTSQGDDVGYNYPSTCALSLCLSIMADSAGLGFGYCHTTPFCVDIDLGTAPLDIQVTTTLDEVNEQALIGLDASGGEAPYYYSVDGTWLMPEDLVSLVFDFGQFTNLDMEVCAQDMNGCMQCEQLDIPNPFIDCEVNFNLVQDDNLVSVVPQLYYGGQLQENLFCFISFENDSMVGSQYLNSLSFYYDSLGDHQICYMLTSIDQNAYPNCPTQICEEVTIASFEMECSAEFTYWNYGNNFYFNDQSTGYYTQLQWDFGNGLTSTESSPSMVFEPGEYLITLTLTNSNTLCESSFQQLITVEEDVALCMQFFNDINHNGIWDTNEIAADSVVVSLDGVWNNVQNGSFDTLIYPASYFVEIFLTNGPMTITSVFPSMGLTEFNDFLLELTPNEDQCPIVIGVYDSFQTTCGRYFFDANNNQQLDADESGVPFGQIGLYNGMGTQVVTTDEQGFYCIDIPLMTSSLVPLLDGEPTDLALPEIFNFIYESGVTGTIPVTLNFGLQQVPTIQDVVVYMTLGNAVSPGFQANVNLTVINESPTGTAATVNAYNGYGQETILVSNEGTITSEGAAWTIELPPFSIVELSYLVLNATYLELGSNLELWSTITVPSGFIEDPSNNQSSIQTIVVGSYDPNNKLVDPSGIGEHGLTSLSVDALEYTINFQNTGSAPAVNVRIVDQIPPELNAYSIQILHTSHAATMITSGQQVEWLFENIMLPDSNANEPLSHGHVTFRIIPFNEFEHGDLISNQAEIYFDFNEPIITNTAINTFDESVGVFEADDESPWSSFPNPCSSDEICFPEFSGVLIIYSSQGNLVMQYDLGRQQHIMPVDSLPAGFYTAIEMASSRKAKFVIQ
jgi:PKD repeat protein